MIRFTGRAILSIIYLSVYSRNWGFRLLNNANYVSVCFMHLNAFFTHPKLMFSQICFDIFSPVDLRRSMMALF